MENVIELPIAFAEKLSEGMLPLMEMPKPKGAEPENIVEAEKSMTYTPSSSIVIVSVASKCMLFMLEVRLNRTF
uniref:DUF3982 domain-containing protein n=1 Tax=Bacillus bingmayongensis TaxID=1150157 RepID=UPI001ED985AB|nr:DUF3982 domain-containing protein [Bacillus bingmayongensis]